MPRSRHETATVALGVLQPFYRLLETYELESAEPSLEQPDPWARARTQAPGTHIPIDEARACLESAVERVGDPDVGLKAGRLFDMEHGAALTYAASSAPTVGAAMSTATRAIGLLTNLISYRVVHKGRRAEVHLDSKRKLGRAEADFVASVLRSHHCRTHAFEIPGTEWFFQHARPDDVSEYQRTFGPIPCHFSASYLGFSFDAVYLDLPLRTADARYHQIATRQLEQGLLHATPTRQLLSFVRKFIHRDLASSELGVELVAHQLQMSRRTLGRRLREEGTTFRDLLDDVRRQQSLRYLSSTDRDIGEVASLVGFSDVTAFYRAFRRWMGTTPVEFREQLRARPES